MRPAPLDWRRRSDGSRAGLILTIEAAQKFESTRNASLRCCRYFEAHFEGKLLTTPRRGISKWLQNCTLVTFRFRLRAKNCSSCLLRQARSNRQRWSRIVTPDVRVALVS